MGGGNAYAWKSLVQKARGSAAATLRKDEIGDSMTIELKVSLALDSVRFPNWWDILRLISERSSMVALFFASYLASFFSGVKNCLPDWLRSDS